MPRPGALRTSKPTVISVNLRCNPPNLVLEVTDNGSGIADSQAASKEGFGFSNMRARADWWITGAAFPSTLDGHPPDVRPILFSHTCRFRSSSTMGMEDGPFCQLFCLDHRTDTCQGHVGNCIQRSAVRPTRSVRSSRLAASMGRRAIHRPAFSGKQGPAADASFATTALSPLGDRVSFLALDFYHERHQNVGRLNILVDKTLPGELTQRSCKANTEAEEPA